MMVPLVRDEEDLEDLYIDDFFWLHERGVDLLFIFVFLHLLRKLYLVVIDYEQEFAWKSGAFSFLILQAVVFLGLVLCCTHLSEITLTIAANALHTLFFFKGKAYWWIFTDRFLNTDTMLRLAYAHYVSAFFLAFLGLIHGIDMHYDWKNENVFDSVRPEMTWWDEALSNELGKTIEIILTLIFFCGILYEEPEALSYEIFMWGDVGMSSDIRFYGVAPHWYFRPYMAWLIVCPHHRPGLFGLAYFFIVIYYQPNLHGIQEFFKKSTFSLFFQSNSKYVYKGDRTNVEYNVLYQFYYAMFIMSIAYSTTFLPYGRFYNRLGGNIGMLLAYMFIFFLFRISFI
jgi:quinol-cytochrome oxidoreductase complex cytochrome b subunit